MLSVGRYKDISGYILTCAASTVVVYMIQEGKMPSLSVHMSMNMTKLRSHTVCNTSTHVNTALDRCDDEDDPH